MQEYIAREKIKENQAVVINSDGTVSPCKVKAIINGDRIECGKCGALLAVHKPFPGKLVLNDGLFKYDSNQKENIKSLEIKCKHKDKGHTCNTVNEILL